MTQLSLEEIKDLILFCKDNQVHSIRVGTVEAHLSPDVKALPQGTKSPTEDAFPKWVTGD
jgi:hypothetical protein